VLRKVHRIKTKKFGNWKKNDLGHNPNFIDEWQDKARIRLAELKKAKFYDSKLEDRVAERIGQLLKPFEKKFKPVLTHGDPGNDNCILSKKGHLILIDWDNALSAVWIRDYTDLVYWGSYSKHLGKTPEERRKKIKRAFFKGYGKTNFTSTEIDRVEKAMSIYHAVNLMPYYYSNQRNMKAFNNAQKRLYELMA
jgi:thiamine kinase-like enzyme